MKVKVTLNLHNHDKQSKPNFNERFSDQYKISPPDYYIVAQLAITSFYRSRSCEMGTILDNIWRKLQAKTQME